MQILPPRTSFQYLLKSLWLDKSANSRCVLNSSRQQPMKPRFPATRPWDVHTCLMSCGIVWKRVRNIQKESKCDQHSTCSTCRAQSQHQSLRQAIKEAQELRAAADQAKFAALRAADYAKEQAQAAQWLKGEPVQKHFSHMPHLIFTLSMLSCQRHLEHFLSA